MKPETQTGEVSRIDAFIDILKSGKYWLGVAHGALIGWFLGVVLLA